MKPNIKREALLDSLYPKGQSATITLDLNAFQQHLDTFLAMEAEVNTAGEKARVAKVVEKEPQVAQGIPVEEVKKASTPKPKK